MKDYKTFFKKNGKFSGDGLASVFGRTNRETQHIAVFSDFFNSVPDNMFCTNEMYSCFKNALLASIGVCSTKDKVIIDIFETEASSEDKREMLLIGFRRYIGTYYHRLRHEYRNALLQVSLFAVLGILLIYLLYSLHLNISEWLRICIETVGTVLIWQFVGYMAFEYNAQRRELNRMKQIKELEYTFRKWE